MKANANKYYILDVFLENKIILLLHIVIIKTNHINQLTCNYFNLINNIECEP